MYPNLYTKAGVRLAVLNNIIKDTAKIKRVVNGEFTFAFDAFEKDLKSEYFSGENVVKIESQDFDIKYIEQEHEIDVMYKIKCEHVSYRLEDGESNTYENYAFTGTPTSILTDILGGTDFTVGTVDFTDSITFTINSKITKRALIKELANLLGGEIEYTSDGYEINILNSIGANNNYHIRFGKNLKSLQKIIDRRGDSVKTYYKVDIIRLKNTNEYKSKGLEALEVIEVGDTVRIIDEVVNIDVENRILSRSYNPILEVNTELEIANTIELITNKIKQIETTSVIKEEIYNGVRIGPDEGYVAERSDNTAKVVMNATEGLTMYKEDGGGYTETFQLDANGNIVMSGSITITGGSGIGNLTDAGLLASLDSVNGTYIDNNSISAPKIQTNAITTDKIQAGAVTADEIFVTTLSAIETDLGTITAGTLNAVNIYSANIDIDEDVQIGGKIKMTNASDAGTAEFGTLKVLQSGPTYVDSLYLGKSLTWTGSGYSVTYLPRQDIFCNKSFFYGDIVTTQDLSATGDIYSNGDLTLERTASGGYIFMRNANGKNTVQLGPDSGDSYLPGLLVLYNGATTSEARIYMGVSNTDDDAFLSLYKGSNQHTRIDAFADGGYLRNYDSSGNNSTYLGVNSGESGNGLLILYDNSENQSVELYADEGEGGRLNLKYENSNRIILKSEDLYGSFLYMYNDIGNEIVRLGSTLNPATHGRLNLSNSAGNERSRLYVDPTNDDGRLDLVTSGGGAATMYFDGSNIRVIIGGTTYTLTKT